MAKNLRLITESSKDFEIKEKGSSLYVEGIFSSAETETKNGRIYKRDLLEREVQKLMPKVGKSLWGELNHPENPTINPERICMLTQALIWKGNDLYGKAKLLNTPMGEIAKELVKEGNLGISSRGLGTVAEDGYVNEDLKIITWDLVTMPSNNSSWVNGIYEAESWSPCQISQMLKEQEEKPGEERSCICWKCWKTITTIRDCSMELCPVCHKEMNNWPDDNRLDREPAKIYICYCQYCQESHRFRNRKCSEVTCPTCHLKLKQERVDDAQELFQKQIQEWQSVIREREFG